MTDDSAVEALLSAHALGATVYDTSDTYGLGHSQRLLGRMLAQVPRESVRITCTVGAFKGTGLNAYSSLTLHGQVEQSLENLGVNCLDVLTLHHTDFGPRDRYLEEALETLQALREMGSIKAVGLRGPNRLVADPAAACGDRESAARFAYLFQRLGPDVICTPFNALIPPPAPETVDGEDDEDIFSFARRHRVTTMIFKPLAQGLLTGAYAPGTVFGPGDVRSGITAPVLEAVKEGLQPLRDRFGSAPRDLVRVALRYCLNRCPDSIVLTGFTSSQQVTSNYEGLSSELSDEDYAFADSAYGALRRALEVLGRLRSREAAVT
ncbi:aldo/keto reductase (plasmid) [Streptomyces sp. NBC_01724]|uniref:aldo/keto reductase n=1 Tax=Streptomyces sp. NBC_01724 TaxID=2975922 RepID=UPI002E2FFF56|nr:aldo/keto reductase [Streptomyces sp. NBC_01724]